MKRRLIIMLVLIVLTVMLPLFAQAADSPADIWKGKLGTGSVELKLNTDSSAILRMAGPDKTNSFSLTWQLSGSTISMNGDGMSIQATYNGSTVRLNFGGQIATLTQTTAFTAAQSNASPATSDNLIGNWFAMYNTFTPVTMKFKENNELQIIDPSRVLNMTWRLNGSTLTMTGSGKTIKATYDGSVIICDWLDQSLTFHKKTGNTPSPVPNSDAPTATTLHPFVTATPRPTSSAVGSWIVHLPDGDVTLIVRSNGTATMNVLNSTYEVTWKLSGSSFTLYQRGIPVNGTFANEKISLTMGAYRYVFSRMETSTPTPRPTAAPAAEDQITVSAEVIGNGSASVTVTIQDAEILFQRIPWRTDAETCLTQLESLGFTLTDSEPEKLYVHGAAIEAYATTQLGECYVLTVEKNIGGYQPERVEASFLRGQLVSVRVIYAFDTLEMTRAAYNKLLIKVSDVYGAPVSEQDSACFLGANSTLLLLNIDAQTQCVELIYCLDGCADDVYEMLNPGNPNLEELGI